MLTWNVVYKSKLLIYDAGDTRTTWVSFWKAMALLQFGTTLVFAVPPLWQNENQPDPKLRKAQAILGKNCLIVVLSSCCYRHEAHRNAALFSSSSIAPYYLHKGFLFASFPFFRFMLHTACLQKFIASCLFHTLCNYRPASSYPCTILIASLLFSPPLLQHSLY